MARPEWIEVGRVSRPHGIRGEVRIVPDSDNPERFAVGSVVYARPGRAPLVGGKDLQRKRLSITEVRGEADFPIVAFAEVVDREAAEAIRSFVLEVASDDLPALAEGEFYPFELEGLKVKDLGGSVVGEVAEIIDSPAHPLLVVRTVRDEEALVPFVLAAVPLVAPGDGFLVVDDAFLDRSEDGR